MIVVDAGLLRHIDRERDTIVSRIITSGVLPEQRTLVVGVVADAFVDRLLAALENGSYLELLTWLDRTCDTYAYAPQIGSMLAGATRALLAIVGASRTVAAEIEAELISLEQSIGGVAFKLRRRSPRPDAVTDEPGRLIHDLLQQMETTDPLTLEHSHAVSMWCARIARRLSLSESEVTHSARCGLVHDLGKMKIPTEILHAPRSLTVEEWTIVRAHPALGEEIVQTAKPLRQFAATIRSHHERLDGKGYPDGLTGSQISLTTRIVSVADAFNAMIGRRPYRLPMAPGNALDQLHRFHGTQFDPIVVEAIIDVVSHTEPH